MESYNQTFNESSSNDASTEEVPLFVTYLNMVVILVVTIIVITPAVIVINVIWQTRELHTKYFFFVVNLLTTNIASIIVRTILQYLIMILYLADINSNFTSIVLKWSVLLPYTMLHLMTVQLPITLAAEQMIVIGFPYRHRSIMTTKTVICVLATMWGLSAILTATITITVPANTAWSLALVHYGIFITVIFGVLQLISAISIVVVNAFLLYKITVSNRKAKENERLGNEKEVK